MNCARAYRGVANDIHGIVLSPAINPGPAIPGRAFDSRGRGKAKAILTDGF